MLTKDQIIEIKNALDQGKAWEGDLRACIGHIEELDKVLEERLLLIEYLKKKNQLFDFMEFKIIQESKEKDLLNKNLSQLDF